RRMADLRGALYRVARNLIKILREIRDESERDKVQHDRVDNLMRTELRFQYARDRSPNAAGDDRRQNAEWDQQHRRQTRPRPIRHYRLPIDHRRYRHAAEFYRDPRRRERTHVKLAFRADVQKAASKSDRHRQARKYKRRRVMQRPSD